MAVGDMPKHGAGLSLRFQIVTGTRSGHGCASLGHAIRLCCLLLLVLLGGCDKKAAVETNTDKTAAPAYTHESTGGPVSMTISVDRTDIGLADQIVLTQTLRSEPGFEADLPEYLPEDLDQFAVMDIRQEPSRSYPDGSTVQTRRFTLEPNRSGELTIAPMYVYFHKADAKAESYFTTEPIDVKVAPIENASALQIEGPSDIFRADPDALHETGPSTILIAAIALILCTVAVVLIARYRRGRPFAITPAHELALTALDRLLERNLVKASLLEPFFVELSGILRTYIERRFDVRAPELTTEEFLLQAATNDALTGHRGRLKEFLSLADQVKFATYRPPGDDVDQSVNVVRQFVRETADGVA